MKTDTPRDCQKCVAFDHCIFRDLSESAANILKKNKIKNTYKKGQTLFIDGFSSHGIFCVSKGSIKLTKNSSQGKESIVRISKVGSFIDEGLFTDGIHKLTATALEDSNVCFIDKSFLETLIQTEPGLGLKMIKRMSKRAFKLQTNLVSLQHKNVRERLAELLIRLKEEHSDCGPDGRYKITLNLKRSEMATMVGTANETIIRFIKEFKEANLIEEIGKTIYIKDLPELYKWAN
ncbi:MAG: Crp/Fnr family transcriptional regulator [Bacteriovoracaceae bacterium]|nr:Crp/Fnr family transcriptional regulator [Bacteriovoracaceae bacterium]